jgi:hypothetical protein
VAGPWFVVYRSGSDWQYMGDVWISNGKTDCKGKFYVRGTLSEYESEELQNARASLH